MAMEPTIDEKDSFVLTNIAISIVFVILTVVALYLMCSNPPLGVSA